MGCGNVSVSGLPERGTVLQWKDGRYDRWISLCGVSIDDIISDDVVGYFQGNAYRLPDPFSGSEPWTDHVIPSAQDFLSQASPTLRGPLILAVRDLVQSLRAGQDVIVFCHLGKSRSPLVAAAGLMIAESLEPHRAWQKIERKHAIMPISKLAISALVWLESEWRRSGGYK